MGGESSPAPRRRRPPELLLERGGIAPILSTVAAMKAASLLQVLTLAALLAGAGQGRAQVRAPELIEEDLPEVEAPARTQQEPTPPRTPAPAPAATPAPSPESSPRPLALVQARFADLEAAWRARREALRDQSPGRARAAEQRFLSLRLELGIENLPDHAAAEVRASARALESRAASEALEHAELAVALAPDLPIGYVARAEARLARDPLGQLSEVLHDLGAAVAAAARDPSTRRAFQVDVAAAGLLAVFVAGALVVILLFARRARLVLHDFHHLPLARLASPLQAGVLALLLLALPLALRLGPVAWLALLALAATRYLGRAERLLASLVLAAMAALPWGAQHTAALAAWAGTLAEQVHRLEQGVDDGRVQAALEGRAARGELPPPALVALGRHHKRRGDLAAALRWYEAAGADRADALVNAGNVRFLQGDLERAKAAYLAAVDRAEVTGDAAALAAAHYDLSKVYLRASALEQAQEARRKAALEDAALVARGADDDFRANRWLVDVPLSSAEIATLAVDESPRAVGEAVRARLAGASPAWPWLPLAAALCLWPVALLGRRRARPCERCGGAACERCGPAAGSLCGQCVNAFVKKGAVEVGDRRRKEAQVRARARIRRFAARGLALVAGGAGHVVVGRAATGAVVLVALAFLAAVAVTWRGLAPPPHPTRWEALAKLGVVVPLGLLLWALSARDLFRRTRS